MVGSVTWVGHAAGEVRGLPDGYKATKRALFWRDSPGKEMNLTLVTPEGEQEVQVWQHESSSHLSDGSYSFSLTVCPVETINTDKAGARAIRVSVDTEGHATFL